MGLATGIGANLAALAAMTARFEDVADVAGEVERTAGRLGLVPLQVSRRLRALNPKPQAGIRTPVTGFMPFTDDACDAVVQARAEADRLGLDRPGSGQLLLALAGTGQGVAAQALQRLGLSPATVRQQVTQVTQVTQDTQVPPPADTPLARQVMPRAVGEAVAQGHDYIGTEHILLGMFHAGDDTAARALTGLGAGEHEVRAAIIAITGDPGPGRPVHHRRHKPGPRDDEIRRLRAEVARLADLLRENGIEPGDGGRQTA